MTYDGMRRQASLAEFSLSSRLMGLAARSGEPAQG
jgi:hypothetical protein